jgi:hypothetical protein
MASSSQITVSRRPALAGIGERLREMFDAMTSGPQPAYLVDLVDQLEAQAAAQGEVRQSERARLSPA